MGVAHITTLAILAGWLMAGHGVAQSAEPMDQQTVESNPMLLPRGLNQPARFDENHIVVRRAGHWSNFQSAISGLGSRNISSTDQLESAMIDLARYDGSRIAPSWMAINALIALQIPEFVAGVRAWEASYGRDLVLERIHTNPMTTMQFDGSKLAQAAILRAARSDEKRVKLVGTLFKEQAYSMQKLSWANKKQGGKKIRLDAVRLAPKSPTPISMNTLTSLSAPGISSLAQPYNHQRVKTSFLSALKLGPRAAWATPSAHIEQPKISYGREATMTRILGLAALMVLEEDQTHSNFSTWLKDTELRECIDWARVHLNQCIAAGHFVFESSFCIAEHQLNDGSKCIGDILAKPAPAISVSIE